MLETVIGHFVPAMNDAYKASYFFEASDRLKQSAYHLLNRFVSWSVPNGRLDVQRFGKNHTNSCYYANAAASTSDAYILDAPRQFDVRIGVHF
jgi:hypothetical protein